jgi:lysophospholipase L1-like esterase
MKRRNLLTLLALVAGGAIFIFMGCHRILRPERADRRIIKVACVGDSITYGHGVEEREVNNYPKQLGDLLGSRFEVRNFGHNSATMSRVGDHPYANTDEFKAALTWQPDMIIIILGTNDTKPRNWKDQTFFKQETRWLIDQFRSLMSKPQVWACLPVPVYSDTGGITGLILDDSVIPALMEVTTDSKVPIIDLNYALTGYPEMFPDNIHPNAAGATLMAKTIFQAIRP